jgi:nitronate monooxygenase
MIRTRFTALMGIEHPILNAPMSGAATAELAAAVSAAGGLGMIGASLAGGPDWLREQIRLVRARTDRPFGVGFISSAPDTASLMEVVLAERVPAISLSFADPTPYVGPAHAVGIKVLAQVQTVAQATQAARAGVDAIAAQGSEAGGHTGSGSGSLPLILATIAVAGEIPVLAAGGVGDGRGLAAVLLLGAEGAWIGTRFVASRESVYGEARKARIVAAGTDDTLPTRAYDLVVEAPFPPGIVERVIPNDFTATWHGRDAEIVARRAELRTELRAAPAGDTRITKVAAGTVAGIIGSIEPAAEIVRTIAADAERILRERPALLLG